MLNDGTLVWFSGEQTLTASCLQGGEWVTRWVLEYFRVFSSRPSEYTAWPTADGGLVLHAGADLHFVSADGDASTVDVPAGLIASAWSDACGLLVAEYDESTATVSGGGWIARDGSLARLPSRYYGPSEYRWQTTFGQLSAPGVALPDCSVLLPCVYEEACAAIRVAPSGEESVRFLGSASSDVTDVIPLEEGGLLVFTYDTLFHYRPDGRELRRAEGTGAPYVLAPDGTLYFRHQRGLAAMEIGAGPIVGIGRGARSGPWRNGQPR